jgi:hypothetical protein|tara:strand:+ start:137 stop:436 length:300 start_codon:yes stop_codon:yes gene_type:complete
MTKFLKVRTGANGDLIMPADKFVMVSTGGGSFTTTIINYLTTGAFDTITLTHAADTNSGFNMINYIQNQLIQVAQSKWSESILDITNDAPTVISNVVIS